jgi:hypothetical protein
MRHWFTIGASAILGAIILGYGYFEAQEYLKGPQLFIDIPQNGATLTEAFTTIKGRAENISRLTLYNRQIFVNENGIFKEHIVLPEGYTEITAKAEDRFGRTTEVALSVILKSNTPDANKDTEPNKNVNPDKKATTTEQVGT